MLVEEDEYLLPLSRYIHLNPIRRAEFKDTDLQTQLEYLEKYPWSTFPGYCYLKIRKKNIDYSWLLKTYFGNDNTRCRRRYREYVCKALGGNVENTFQEVVHQSILGSQDFVEWVKNKLPRRGQREMPSLTKLHREISAEKIIEEVAKAGDVQPGDLKKRKTKFKILRQMAMELSYRYSNHKLKEIGGIFGVDYSTVSQSRARLQNRIKSNRKLAQQFMRIQKRIVNLSNPKI